MTDPTARSEIVLALAEEFLERYRKGERPRIKEYIDRHPELMGEIREVFPAMAMMEKIAIAEESLAGRGVRNAAGPALEQLGDYRIIREVGRGGMGIVFEAEQVSLGRHVALKVLPNKALLDARHKRRFEREARSAAKLHHTNIVPVFGVGEQDGLPYYVMQFIQGLGMNDVLDELIRQQTIDPAAPPGELRQQVSATDVAQTLLERKVPLNDATVDQRRADGAAASPSRAESNVSSVSAISSAVLPGQSEQAPRKQNYWQSIANVGLQVASALEYAHTQGVLHRDIKPSNLLLDRHGTVWVTDFGLAKSDDQDDLTHTGDLVGTLRYMPPEAFEGKADRRSDVYSLGLTLYEMLAMRPAFTEKDRNPLIHKVTTMEPDRLDKINPAIPRDLVTVVHKAIERNPDHRYASAGELAADLRCFLNDEPIQARRISPPERMWRWSRRRPAAAAALAFGILLVAALIALPIAVAVIETNHGIVLAKQKTKIEEAAAELAKQKTKVEEALKQSHRQSAVLTLERALGVCEQGEVARGLLLLARGLKMARKAEAADLEEAFRWNLGAWSRENHELLHALPHGADVRTVAFSPDSKLVACGGADNQVRLWDTVTGRPHGSPLVHPGQVQALAFHPDGRLLTGCEDGEARLWDVTTGLQVGPSLVHNLPEVNDTLKKRWPFHQGIASVAFSPDGSVFVTGGNDGLAHRWETADGRKIGTPLRNPDGITVVAFHPQGRHILTAGLDRSWRLWDAKTGVLVNSRPTGNNIWGGAFHPYGGKFATGHAQERGARHWFAPPHFASIGTSEPMLKIVNTDGTLFKHFQTVCAVAYTPDGALLLTGSHDRLARFWDVETGRPFGTPLQHRDWVLAVATSPDGQLAVTGSRDGTARVWRIARGSKLHTLRQPGWVRGGPAFDRESKTVLTGGEGSSAFLWDVASGKQIGPAIVIPPRPGDCWVSGTAISPDGKTAYTVDHGRGVVHFWDTQTRQHLGSTQPHGDEVWRLALSPDGRTLLTGTVAYKRGPGRGARLWDARTGQPIGTPLEHGDRVVGIAFRPDGKTLTGSEDRTTRLWDAATGAPLGPPKSHISGIRAVAFRPDGMAVALGNADRTAQAWDPKSWTPIGPVMQHNGEINFVAYNPRGDLLFTASTDYTGCIWHAATGRKIGPALRHTQDVLGISCSPDGKIVATVSDDGTAALWAIPAPVKDDPEQVWRWAQRITALTLGEDDAFHVLTPDEIAKVGTADNDFELLTSRERPVAHDLRLLKCLRGERILKDAVALNELAVFAAQEKKMFVATAELFQEYFRTHPDWINARIPSPPGVLVLTNRRYAAGVAAMASLGQGDGGILRVEQRAAWRMKGIEWMHAETVAWNKQLEAATPEEASSLLQLQSRDPWLAPLREAAYFDRRPPVERDAFRKLWGSAAQMYAKAFAINAKLESDAQASHRYNAACCAALAGCGSGSITDTLNTEARARLREQALAWLRADLAHWKKQAESAAPADREAAARAMRTWQSDADLNGLRANEALKLLPADENEAFKTFWIEVREILKNADR